jgi:hypothetical protein
MADNTVKPIAAVRRFDVLAQYNRRQAANEGRSMAQAKGHGLRLARLAAARRAFEHDEPCEAVRDSPRANWKPAAKQGPGG